MKTFLVIATGAKTGGALIIINQFLKWAATKNKINLKFFAQSFLFKKKI